MALNSGILTTAFDDIHNIDLTQDPEIVRQAMVALFVQAIEDYVKSGDVVVSSGSSAGTYKIT